MKTGINSFHWGKLIYFTVVAVSLGLFTFTTVDIIVEFYQEKTGFNIVEHAENELELPAATVCITDVFRNVNETNAREILSNLTAFTFSADHIFYEGYDVMKDKFTIQETFNYQNGHCFTVSTTETQSKNGIARGPLLYLRLKTNHKYKISIHEPGAELWLQSDLKPSKVISFEVNGYELEEEKVASIRIELAQKKITNQNRKDYRCDRTQSLESFTKCSFDILSTILHHVNCSTIILKVNKTLEESRICQDADDFTDMKRQERDILEKILVNDWNEKCLRPCEKIEYTGSMTMAHENSMKLMPFDLDTKQHVGIWIQYDDFMVQEHQEFFVLDENGLVASIGGFMGIFLGLSTLSIAEWIHRKIDH